MLAFNLVELESWRWPTSIQFTEIFGLLTFSSHYQPNLNVNPPCVKVYWNVCEFGWIWIGDLQLWAKSADNKCTCISDFAFLRTVPSVVGWRCHFVPTLIDLVFAWVFSWITWFNSGNVSEAERSTSIGSSLHLKGHVSRRDKSTAVSSAAHSSTTRQSSTKSFVSIPHAGDAQVCTDTSPATVESLKAFLCYNGNSSYSSNS